MKKELTASVLTGEISSLKSLLASTDYQRGEASPVADYVANLYNDYGDEAADILESVFYLARPQKDEYMVEHLLYVINGLSDIDTYFEIICGGLTVQDTNVQVQAIECADTSGNPEYIPYLEKLVETSPAMWVELYALAVIEALQKKAIKAAVC